LEGLRQQDGVDQGVAEGFAAVLFDQAGDEAGAIAVRGLPRGQEPDAGQYALLRVGGIWRGVPAAEVTAVFAKIVAALATMVERGELQPDTALAA